MDFLHRFLDRFTQRVPKPALQARGEEMDGPDTAITGIWGETLAADMLAQKGYKILGRRIQLGRDEIDLVACPLSEAKPLVIFVEVKTRASDQFGGGRAAVDKRKRHALCRAAAHYMRKLPKTPFRFDLVEVIGSRNAHSAPVIRHYENAFPMELRYVHNGLHRRGGSVE